MNHTPTYFTRDTLIMTDIEFITENGGGIKVKQWWYLMPPYLNETCKMGDGIECMMPTSSHMAAIDLDRSWDDDANACDISSRVYTCDVYREQLRNFHSSDSDFLGNDIGIDIPFSNFDESIDVRESSAVKDPGNLHDVSISFEFLSQSPALEQLLDGYSSTKLVAVVCKNYKQKKLYGTNTFPLQLTYELKHGKKPEDGTATIIKLTGQSPKRSVHILNEVG